MQLTYLDDSVAIQQIYTLLPNVIGVKYINSQNIQNNSNSDSPHGSVSSDDGNWKI
jgi:hypothetical protein